MLTALIGPVCTAESVAAAKAESMTLGDWVSEAVSRLPENSKPPFAPLSPLRGELAFPRYTVEQVAALPCGSSVLRDHLVAFVGENLDRSDSFHLVDYQATMFYEALRHHPHFTREAMALRQFIEAGRELNALAETGSDETTGRPLLAPWPVPSPVPRESTPTADPKLAA